MLPNPTTVATAARGNMSEASVYMFADHPWCAPAARATRTAASQRLDVRDASITGITASAHTSSAVLRLRFKLQPRRSRKDDSHPPLMLPIVAPL